MKILIICHKWGFIGGREQYLFDVIEELRDRGHICSVVYAETTNKPVNTGAAKTVVQYNLPGLIEYNSRNDAQHVRTLRTIIDIEAPDVIFLTDVKNFQLLRLLVNYRRVVAMAHHPWLFCIRDNKTLYFRRKPCNRTLGPGCLLHGCFLGKPLGSSSRFFRYNSLKKLRCVVSLYRQFGCILVCSQFMKNSFLQHRFSPEQVKIIGQFTELPRLQNTWKTCGEATITFLGRIDRYKGVDILLKSLSRIASPFVCNILGDGPWLDKCKRLTLKLGLSNKVRFIGWVSHKEIEPYLRATNVVVVPSIWHEPFGMVGIEAMAYAKPVVAFDTGGISDWLDHGTTGYLNSFVFHFPKIPAKIFWFIPETLITIQISMLLLIFRKKFGH